MWKKYLPLAGLAVGLVIVVYYTIQFANTQTPPQGEQQPEAAQLPPAGAPALEPLAASIEGDAGAPTTGQEAPLPPPAQGEQPSSAAPAAMPPFVVTYDGKSFAPASAEIKKGGSVLFLNQGIGSMWPASAMHPTHAAYPTKGGCVGSTFDACQALPKGASWVFTFDEVGAWKYHDHLNPSATGTIIVK